MDEILILLCSFSQEVTARAVDDADVPVLYTYFALRFGFHVEYFAQLDGANFMNHLL